MSDNLTNAQRHLNMSHIRSCNTKPELLFRRALWSLGFRYRVNDKNLPGKPDVVLPKYRTVVFIHGCFWHGHKDCRLASTPKTNTDYWTTKIARNQQRDQEVWRQLEARGWSVIIVWECELKNKQFEETTHRVVNEILLNGESYRRRQEERVALRRQRQVEHKQQMERQELLLAEIKKSYKTR